jgi:hypothetical protein
MAGRLAATVGLLHSLFHQKFLMLCLRYEPGGEDWRKTKEIGGSYGAISQCKQNSAALKTI